MIGDRTPNGSVNLGRAIHRHHSHTACPTCGELVPPDTLDVHEVLAHPQPWAGKPR